MASLEELRNVRLNKIELLKEAQMDPYPVSVPFDYSIKEIKNKFNDLKESLAEKNISTSGRVMIIRGQGSILFIVLQSAGVRLQAVLRKGELEDRLFNLFNDTVDCGDYISVSGSLFVTTRGEESILIKDLDSMKMLIN